MKLRNFDVKRKLPLWALVPLMVLSTFDPEGMQLPKKLNLNHHFLSFPAPSTFFLSFDLSTSKLPAPLPTFSYFQACPTYPLRKNKINFPYVTSTLPLSSSTQHNSLSLSLTTPFCFGV